MKSFVICENLQNLKRLREVINNGQDTPLSIYILLLLTGWLKDDFRNHLMISEESLINFINKD